MADTNGVPLFQKSADTTLIERKLREAEAGRLVTYDELTAVVGRDIRTQCYANLSSARRSLEAEGVYFDTRPSEGLVRLDEAGKVKHAAGRVRRAGNQLKRGQAALKRVDFAKLTDDEKTKALTLGAQLEASRLFVSAKGQKKIEGGVAAGDGVLSIGQTLELFGK